MVYRLDTIWFPSCAVAAPPLCGICAALGFFMVSWEGGDICVNAGSFDVSVYVAAAETPLSRVLQWGHAVSVTQLEKPQRGHGPSPSPSTRAAKCQQNYAKSCHFKSVSMSRNVLFFYSPEYGFFSTACTSGFWVV